MREVELMPRLAPLFLDREEKGGGVVEGLESNQEDQGSRISMEAEEIEEVGVVPAGALSAAF